MVVEDKPRSVYDDDWTEEDIAKYDEMVALGETRVGKDISPANKFIVEMCAKMTINQMKGKYSDLTPDEIDRIRRSNLRAYKTPIHETPPNDWYYSPENPINKTDAELYDMTRKKPDEDDKAIEEGDEDNYIAEQVDKMLEIN